MPKDVPEAIKAFTSGLSLTTPPPKSVSIAPGAITLTVKQAAGYMNISKEYLYSLARAKKLRHIKIGAKRLFTVQDIEEFIKSRTVEPEEKQETDLVRNVILRAMLGRTNNKLNKR